MCQGYGHGHELCRLVTGEAEHHTLVARSLEVEHVFVVDIGARLQRVADALADVWRLLVHGHDDAAGLIVEAVLGARVPDVSHRFAGNARDVHVGVGRDLAGHDDEARGHERLAGDATVRVLPEDGVQDSI